MHRDWWHFLVFYFCQVFGRRAIDTYAKHLREMADALGALGEGGVLSGPKVGGGHDAAVVFEDRDPGDAVEEKDEGGRMSQTFRLLSPSSGLRTSGPVGLLKAF